MLPGKPSPELPTDQQCDHCGRFFRVSGVESHEANCPVKESDSVVYVDGELRSSRCEHCGVWATLDGTYHKEDCELNHQHERLGGAISFLLPFDADFPEPGDF